ncbi:hypothetical protein [Spiroplasma endosymbiont of Amphimallon solstitiale]|uniref:hypothetical protein n=1 Tax=Spiroplasma endosymbiont of Amphimallon solstitiale TaxID=3066288 RepID=UPI00313B24B2
MYHYFSTKLKDFSAKQQKRITTNENSIKLLENKVDINKQNIDDIKNNWFNIETSPLWKKCLLLFLVMNLEKYI